MLRTPPFRRAVTLLLKRPAVLFPVIGTAIILAIVAALTPLFVSSTASAALKRELEGLCPASFAGTTTLWASTLPGEEVRGSMADQIDANRRALSAAPTHPVLGEPQVTLRGTVISVIRESGPPLIARFLARDGFREHIELLEGEHGPGAYVDDYLARFLGASPGDTLTFNIGGYGPAQIEIQAIYAGIYDKLTDPYWCTVESLLQTNVMGDLPPSPILVDPSQFGDDPELMAAIYAGYGQGSGTWQIPVTLDGISVTEALGAVATLDQIDQVIHPVGENEVPDFLGTRGIHSDLLMVTERVQALTAALRSSIIPLAAVVLVAAAALIGGAGSYWVDRKRAELQYLYVVGAGPGLIAVKAALEFVPAILAGSALGWGLANLLIGLVGPSSSIESWARALAGWVIGGAAVLGLLAVAMVSGLRARRLLDHRPTANRRFTLRIPLLIAAIAGAILVRNGIGESAVTLSENQLVGSVDPLVLFFPLFTFVAVVLFLAGLVIRAFPLLKKIGAHSHAAYLASRRIVSAPTLVVVLIAGAALPVATLIYAASLTRSATSTIDAKGRGFIGADVSTPVYDLIEPPGDISEVSTVVIKTERASLNGIRIDVLAVNGDTFAQGAFWDESFSRVPLDEILATLARESVGGSLPAYVANGSVEGGEVRSAAGDFDVVIQGQIETFPGVNGSRPLLIVDQQRYLELLPGSHYFLWTMGLTEQEIETALSEADIGFAFTVAAATTLDQLKFAAVVWTFDFLEVYAALAGLIAIAGILLYVDTRQRQRNLSYALARRMGLTRTEHLRAGFMELASLTSLGTLAGVLAAWLAARSLYKVLDAVPETPPGPRWIGALDLSLLAIVIALAVSAIGAAIAQRTADTADTSALLRHGE